MGNEAYAMPKMPADSRKGILRGLYRLKPGGLKKPRARVTLFGSGSLLNETLKAQQILEERFEIAAEVWSVTSYKELFRDGLETERLNRLQPGPEPDESIVVAA